MYKPIIFEVRKLSLDQLLLLFVLFIDSICSANGVHRILSEV